MSKSKIQDLIKSCVVPAEDFVEKPKEIIKLSPALDYLFGGGVVSGSFIVITGGYKCGKTATALFMAKQAQALGYKILFCNAEHRLSPRDILSVNGIDCKNVEVVTSTPGNILCAEDFLQIVQYKMNENDKLFVIVDSVSQMCPRELMDGDFTDRFRDSTPGLLSRFSKITAPNLAISSNIFLAITHEIANTSGKGHKLTVEASGNKIQYAHDFKIRVSHATPWIEGEIQIGQSIHWQCTTSALGPPNRKCDGSLRYNYGIDPAAELFTLGKQTQAIRINGSWVVADEETDTKFQGAAKFSDGLRADPELYKKVHDRVYSRLGLKVEN